VRLSAVPGHVDPGSDVQFVRSALSSWPRVLCRSEAETQRRASGEFTTDAHGFTQKEIECQRSSFRRESVVPTLRIPLCNLIVQPQNHRLNKRGRGPFYSRLIRNFHDEFGQIRLEISGRDLRGCPSDQTEKREIRKETAKKGPRPLY
jgi:hypothetical protein